MGDAMSHMAKRREEREDRAYAKFGTLTTEQLTALSEEKSKEIVALEQQLEELGTRRTQLDDECDLIDTILAHEIGGTRRPRGT